MKLKFLKRTQLLFFNILTLLNLGPSFECHPRRRTLNVSEGFILNVQFGGGTKKKNYQSDPHWSHKSRKRIPKTPILGVKSSKKKSIIKAYHSYCINQGNEFQKHLYLGAKSPKKTIIIKVNHSYRIIQLKEGRVWGVGRPNDGIPKIESDNTNASKIETICTSWDIPTCRIMCRMNNKN